jgi:hypothetical protein
MEFFTRSSDIEVAKLTPKERRVLYGIVKYPDLSDKLVARKVDVTRQTVNRLKREYEDAGLVRTMRIPNMNRIGGEIIVFALSRFNSMMTMDKRKKGISMVRRMPQILTIATDMETANLFLVPNFKTYQDLKDQIISFYKKHNFFADEPTIILFSTENMRIVKNHSYAELLSESLEEM